MLRYDPGWHYKMIVNGIGAVCTFIVMIIFAVFKFTEGAWIILLLIPTLVMIFFAIHRHYRALARQLSLDECASQIKLSRNRVIMPISSVHKGTLLALRYARSLSDDVTVVHISIDPNEATKVEAKWEVWGEDVRLVILDSPYRVFFEPLLDYIGMIDAMRKPNEMITIVVPQFVPRHWWNNFLHTRTADSLRKVLLNRENIVISEVPYQVK